MVSGNSRKTRSLSWRKIGGMTRFCPQIPVGAPLAATVLAFAASLPQASYAQEIVEGDDVVEPRGADCADSMQMVRWREDWNAKEDLGDSGLCALKQIPLTDNVAVSFGGELRYRAEPQDGVAFGLSDEGQTGHLFRALAHADVRFGSRVRTFVELGFHDAAGYSGSPPPTGVDRLDLQQAFLDLEIVDDGLLQLRSGRQELSFGSGRLFALREGANVRLSFDGILATSRFANSTLRAFYMRPVEIDRGTFDDDSSSEEFYGIYASTPLGSSGPVLDLYWLGFEAEAAPYFSIVGDEERHSFGARLSGASGAVSYDVEGVWQTGSIANQSIDAWTASAEVSHAFDAPWSPIITAKGAIASGDDDPDDGELNSFNPLYPKLNYFVERTLAAPVNFYNIDLGVAATPVPRLTLSAKALRFWRTSLEDGVYAPSVSPLPIAPDIGGRKTSDVVQFMADWAIRPNFILTGALIHVDLAEDYNAAGYGDTNMGLVQLRWRF